MPHTRNRRTRSTIATGAVAWVCALSFACGGNTESGRSSSGDDGGISIPDGDVVLPDGSIGPNPCVSSSGYAVCGGPNGCFPASQQTMASNCWSCSQDYYDVGVCTNAAEPTLPFNLYADDGEVYVEQAPSVWSALPFDVGALIAANGAADRVRYADWYAWTGDPLPEPTSCPTFTGFSICGGNCDPCGAGQLCTGRSPHHPYGLCVPDPTTNVSAGCDSTHPCGSGTGCVVLQSSSDGQSLADGTGVCMPTASCTSVAANLPGGALCQAQ